MFSSCRIKEINNDFSIKFIDFMMHFNKIELNSKNLIENLKMFKIALEISLQLIYNLDNPSLFILILLKFDENINKIKNKFLRIYNKKIKDESCEICWDNYLDIKIKLEAIINKIKIFIVEEGGDINYTHNIHVKICF